MFSKRFWCGLNVLYSSAVFLSLGHWFLANVGDSLLQMNLWLSENKDIKPCQKEQSVKLRHVLDLHHVEAFLFHCFFKTFQEYPYGLSRPYILYTYIAQCISHHKIFKLLVNPLTYHGGSQPTLWGFLSFHLDEKTSASHASKGCSFIPRAYFETHLVMAVSMVTRYDVISSRCENAFF